jgi:heparan-alpha-glucosaminide N-acetyltransferase
MTTSTFAIPEHSQSPSSLQRRRIVSIDIFRGLTMMVMIFVNYLDPVRGLPWWTHHAHAWENRMTYVDMVFPFFLFIVGMSIPLAIRQRLQRDPSQLSLWGHILSRSAGLIALGLILANATSGDPARMLLPPPAWALLGLTGGILAWIRLPQSVVSKSKLRLLHIGGLLLLVLTFAMFKHRGPAGHTGWIDGSYPEILGLIGYAYFASCLLYVPTRRWRSAPILWFTAALAWCAYATIHHNMSFLHLRLYIWPFGNGSDVSLIMAGIVTSQIFFTGTSSLRARNLQALAFAMLALIAGYLLTPLGISKIRATPTWCLYSIAAATAAFILLYWICDVRGKQRWAFWVQPAGSNTLLTYLLPDIYFYAALLVGFRFSETHWNYGIPGTLITVGFTACVLLVSALLTRMRVHLQL